jgi:hypothetical protein
LALPSCEVRTSFHVTKEISTIPQPSSCCIHPAFKLFIEYIFYNLLKQMIWNFTVKFWSKASQFIISRLRDCHQRSHMSSVHFIGHWARNLSLTTFIPDSVSILLSISNLILLYIIRVTWIPYSFLGIEILSTGRTIPPAPLRNMR